MSVYSKHGNLVRCLYLATAAVCYVLTVGGRLRRNKRVVLCYHGVRDEQKQRFTRQMQILAGNMCNVRITFDDAFANLLDTVLPLLNELRIPAIIFAVPGNLGQSPKWNINTDHPEYKEITMTAQQLVSIQNDLITIGSHTQTHPDLSTLPSGEIRQELVESKENLMQILDKPVEDLALPHGAYNDQVLSIAQECGYQRVYTLDPKLVDVNQTIGTVGRFSMTPDVWPIEFYLTCRGAYAWLYIFRRSLKKVRGLVRSGFRSSR